MTPKLPKWLEEIPLLYRVIAAITAIAGVWANIYYWDLFYEFVIRKAQDQENRHWYLLALYSAVMLCMLTYLHIDSRRKIKLGFAQGIEQGRILEQQDQEFPLFAPLRKSFSEIQSQLAGNQTPEKIEPIISAFAKLMSDWNHLATETDKQNTNQSQANNLHLAKFVLQQYLNQLPAQTVPSTGFHFLPANFEIYAYCVASILENISAHRPENEGTIRVWTLLKEPIKKWYNIASGFNKNLDEFAHSYTWWEEYKKKVTSLRTMGKANDHFVQMRRIVSISNDPFDETKTRVFATNRTPLSILNARKEVKKIKDNCPKLLTEIAVALTFDERPRLNLPIHLIGQCECVHPDHSDWELLKEHFENEFHDE